MKQKYIYRTIALVALSLEFGCAAHQIYDSGQAWQREQCRKMADQDGSKDCLSKTEKRYDDYQYEADKAVK